MNKFNKSVFFIFLVVLLVIVSGCVNKMRTPVALENGDKKEQVSNEDNVELELETKKEVIERLERVNEWQPFNEYSINFAFNFPNSWNYIIEKNTLGDVRMIFSSDARDREMVVNKPIPSVGLEGWQKVESKIIRVDNDTDIQHTIMESKNDLNDRMILLEWQEGQKSAFLQDDLKSYNENSAWMYIPSYEVEFEEYYFSVIDEIVKTIKFK